MSGADQRQEIKEWLRQQGATTLFTRHYPNKYPHLIFRLRQETYDVPICGRTARCTINTLRAVIKRREKRQEVRMIG